MSSPKRPPQGRVVLDVVLNRDPSRHPHIRLDISPVPRNRPVREIHTSVSTPAARSDRDPSLPAAAVTFDTREEPVVELRPAAIDIEAGHIRLDDPAARHEAMAVESDGCLQAPGRWFDGMSGSACPPILDAARHRGTPSERLHRYSTAVPSTSRM
jgi:hypothetical protein